MARRNTTRLIQERARQLRQRQTPSEELLWEQLRDRRLGGHKFRRQHPLGRYIADFYCAQCRLVVELDGAGHQRPEQQAYDQARDAALRAMGCTIVRIPNRQVQNHMAQVLPMLLAALAAAQPGGTP